MTLSPAKPGGWALNELLTSTQMNALQDELVKALDGVGGGTYTLLADLELLGSKLIAGGGVDVGDSGTPGSVSEVVGDSIFRVTSGSSLVGNAGSEFVFSGDMSVTNVGHIDLEIAGALRVQALTAVQVEGGASIEVQPTGVVAFDDSTLQLTGTSIALVQDSVEVRLDEAHQVTVAGSTLTDFRIPMVPIGQLDDGGTRGYKNQLPDTWIQAQDTVSAFYVPLRLSQGDVLDEVSLQLEGGFGPGHAGLLPSDLTELRVVRVGTFGGEVIVAQLGDPSGSAAAYDAQHSITITGMAHTVIGQEAYYVHVVGEFGLNAVANTTALHSLTGKVQLKTLRAPQQSM